jgi:hypothetical protein
MTQRSTEERSAGWEHEDQHPSFPHDAERFAVGLEDDRKLYRASLIAGVLSEAALVGMLITSLQEPGQAARVVLVLLVVGLGLAMGVNMARFRAKRALPTGKRHASRIPASSRQPGIPASR